MALVIFLFLSVSTYIFLNSFKTKDNQSVAQSKQEILQAEVDNIKSLRIDEKIELERVSTSSKVEKESTNNKREKLHKLFSQVVELRRDSRLESAPPLCEVLCVRSTWGKRRKEGVDLPNQIDEFLEKEGARAFDDPDFRLAYELINSLTDMWIEVDSLYKFFEPYMEKAELTESDKIYLSANAPITITKAAVKVGKIIPLSKARYDLIEDLRELRKQCDVLSSRELDETCAEISSKIK